MIDLDDVPPLRRPIVLAAFEGWNDAAEAASTLITHLVDAWDAQPVAALDPEDYYDLQVNRPRVAVEEDTGVRRVTWPTTTILVATPPGMDRDVILVDGIEPSMRWRSFVGELLSFAEENDAELVVCLGALLAEVPHTRPLPVLVTSENAVLRERLTAERSTYEGPTGIVGILADAANDRDLPAVSVWASVPHYAAGAHSAKATLAMIRRLEDLFGWTLPHGDLAEGARAWERGVDELAGTEEEVADYVRHLEAATDAADSPAASGDAIAREFERYLRGRGEPDAPR
ncbi:MAG: PAC2 family protein [Actinobacteria bacterium]|nr:PAC2 family protein [Actinomycetota bacterium]